MLGGAGVFYVAAVVAAILGFGGAGAAGIIGKVLFFVFLALFVLTLSAGLRGLWRSPPK
jgi:uncharacterized membrane protein YtjA (UPF0391 family)